MLRLCHIGVSMCCKGSRSCIAQRRQRRLRRFPWHPSQGGHTYSTQRRNHSRSLSHNMALQQPVLSVNLRPGISRRCMHMQRLSPKPCTHPRSRSHPSLLTLLGAMHVRASTNHSTSCQPLIQRWAARTEGCHAHHASMRGSATASPLMARVGEMTAVRTLRAGMCTQAGTRTRRRSTAAAR